MAPFDKVWPLKLSPALCVWTAHSWDGRRHWENWTLMIPSGIFARQCRPEIWSSPLKILHPFIWTASHQPSRLLIEVWRVHPDRDDSAPSWRLDRESRIPNIARSSRRHLEKPICNASSISHVYGYRVLGYFDISSFKIEFAFELGVNTCSI